MQFPAAFTIDERYDRVHASDRRSRFGAYLTMRTSSFLDAGDAPTANPAIFAVTAFTTGLSPVMAPPYVATHRRILNARSHIDEERRVAMAVDLAVPLPPSAAELLTWRWRGWDTTGATSRYRIPDDNDRPAAFAQVTVRIPIDSRRLPEPRYRRDGSPNVEVAKEAVQLTALQLNGTLGEVLAALAPRRAA